MKRWGLQQFVALLLSLLLWALARSNGESISTKNVTQLTMNVPIRLENVPKTMTPFQMSHEEVRVTVQGESTTIASLRENHIKAWADMGGFEANNSWPSVKILVPGDLRIVSQDPEKINVEMSALTTKVVPIKVHVSGSPGSGLSVGQAQLEPTQVRVVGPEVLINDVVAASSRVVLSGQNQDYSLELHDLVPVTAQGREVSSKLTKLKIVPASVSATIPIVSDSRTVALAVTLDDVHLQAPKGFRVRLELEPQYVTARLNRKQKPPTFLKARPLTAKLANEPKTFDLDLSLPDGLELIGSGSVKLKATPEPTGTAPSPAPGASGTPVPQASPTP